MIVSYNTSVETVGILSTAFESPNKLEGQGIQVSGTPLGSLFKAHVHMYREIRLDLKKIIF